jgi:hypothetical protein
MQMTMEQKSQPNLSQEFEALLKGIQNAARTLKESANDFNKIVEAFVQHKPPLPPSSPGFTASAVPSSIAQSDAVPSTHPKEHMPLVSSPIASHSAQQSASNSSIDEEMPPPPDSVVFSSARKLTSQRAPEFKRTGDSAVDDEQNLSPSDIWRSNGSNKAYDTARNLEVDYYRCKVAECPAIRGIVHAKGSKEAIRVLYNEQPHNHTAEAVPKRKRRFAELDAEVRAFYDELSPNQAPTKVLNASIQKFGTDRIGNVTPKALANRKQYLLRKEFPSKEERDNIKQMSDFVVSHNLMSDRLIMVHAGFAKSFLPRYAKIVWIYSGLRVPNHNNLMLTVLLCSVDGILFPFAMMLHPKTDSQDTFAYVTVLREVKDFAGETWAPTAFITDFEQALMEAPQRAGFPTAAIFGASPCLLQACYQWITNNQLEKHWDLVRESLRCLIEAPTKRAYDIILEHVSTILERRVPEFWAYFNRVWLAPDGPRNRQNWCFIYRSPIYPRSDANLSGFDFFLQSRVLKGMKRLDRIVFALKKECDLRYELLTAEHQQRLTSPHYISRKQYSGQQPALKLLKNALQKIFMQPNSNGAFEYTSDPKLGSAVKALLDVDFKPVGGVAASSTSFSSSSSQSTSSKSASPKDIWA